LALTIYTHTLIDTLHHARCYVEIKGTQDLKIYSHADAHLCPKTKPPHAHSLILSHLCVLGDAEEAELECEKSRRVLLWASGTDEQIQEMKQKFESAQIKWKKAETRMRHIQALREEVDKTAGALWAVESVQDSKAADSEGLDGDLWGSGVPDALVPDTQATPNEPIVPKLALPGRSSEQSATAAGSTCDCGQPLMPGSKLCQTCGIQSQHSLNFKSGSFASSLSSLGLGGLHSALPGAW
jgi:hypothetical protein